MTAAVTVTDLVKRYRRDAPPAVDGLGFTVGAGEVFGLLGPNGAGKTTTVGVLTTRVTKTSGTALVHGVDVARDPTTARQLLAVVPQRNNLDRALSIRQNLLFHASYHGVGRAERNRRADEILARMGLTEKAGTKVDMVSGGQAQRVMIARALMHRPKVLFLDEPSTGLDPQARLFVHERVSELHEDGVTVVLTTHDMDEAAKLCNRVGIVDHGKLLALDTPNALMRSLPGSATLSITVALHEHDPDRLAKLLSDMDGVERVEHVSTGPQEGPDSGVFRLYTEPEPATMLPGVLAIVTEAGCELSDMSVGTPTLEDVFIHMTGRELR